MTSADLQSSPNIDAPQSASRLAITSLILSLVFCCPLTTLAGIVTGVIAVVFTTRDRALSGRWLAILAIVISLVGTAIQAYVIYEGYQVVLMPIRTGPQSLLREGEAGNIEAFQSRFEVSSASVNTAENARSFLAEVKDRYGAFTGAALDQGSVPNKMKSPVNDFVSDYQLDFANGRMRATCAIEIFNPKGELSMRLKSLVIHDADRGDLSYPPTSKSDAPAPSTGEKP